MEKGRKKTGEEGIGSRGVRVKGKKEGMGGSGKVKYMDHTYLSYSL